jgi:hypothetical protein
MIRTFFAFIFCAEVSVQAFDDTSTYLRTNIAGYTVLVSSNLLARPLEFQAAMGAIGTQAAEIENAVESRVLNFFRSVPIWVEWQSKTNGAAEYHPSREWLARNGYNPEKAKAIEINNARNFVNWAKSDQPSMLLHELAHAFHDQVLGWNDQEVKRAFQAAKNSGKYLKVAHANGKHVKAYALTDEKEYFAELTEAYFGRNDFLPFTRSELRVFDEQGFRTIEEKWRAFEKKEATE